MQTTIKAPVKFTGTGLHSGRPVRLTILPAAAEHGIWFRRTDLRTGDRLVPARWDAVLPSRLCTRIQNDSGVEVSTIEHLMAALAGCGVHNALIEISGPEVPILDGSAAPYVKGILSRGLRLLDAPVRLIEVLKPVEVTEGLATARLLPSDALDIAFRIDFEAPAIGRQSKSVRVANGAFVRELCDSRTFCLQSDVDTMREAGLALGGTTRNAVVFDGDTVVSPGGLRHRDEPVRHKMLDAIGDLALAGAPLLARYEGDRAGHMLTNRLLRALFADPDAFRMRLCDTATARLLPGAGLRRTDIPQVA